MKCLCCGKLLSDSHRKQGGFYGKSNTLPDYCDSVCYAAHATLTESALVFWRAMCRRLDVSPTRPIS